MDKETLIAQGLTEAQADTVIKAHKDAIANNFVPLSVHTEVRDDLKAQKETVAERDKQIAQLGQDVGSVEDWKKQVADLKASNAESAKQYADTLAKERRSNTIKSLVGNDVHDTDYVIGLLDFDKIVFNEDNTVASGFKEQYEVIKKDKPFAFKTEEDPVDPVIVPKGNQTQTGKTTTPPKDSFKGETFVKGLAQARNEANTNKSNYFGENKEG